MDKSKIMAIRMFILTLPHTNIPLIAYWIYSIPPITTSPFIILLALVCVTNEFYMDGGPRSVGLRTRQNKYVAQKYNENHTYPKANVWARENWKRKSLQTIAESKNKPITISLFMLPSGISWQVHASWLTKWSFR